MPWSVKGVGADARETAKEAARRAGMTLGEWLNAMIAENAVETEREQREATLKDIAAQLSRMDRGATAAAPARTAPSGNDLQSVLERAMSEARNQARAVEDRTAGALDSMVKWMDRAETRRREDISLIAAAQERTSTALRDALGLVTARMDSIERTVASGDNSAPLRKAIERLETRIEALDRREAEGFVPPKVEKSLRDLEGRLVDLADRMDRPDAKAEASAARINRIEASLGSILERLDSAARQADADKIPAPGSIEDAIAQIRAKQAMLDGDAFLAPVRKVGDSITEVLKADIAELAARLDELRGRDTRPALQDLRTDLANLTRTVRMIDPQERLVGIEHSLAGFSDVMADLRRSQPDIAPLREPLDRLTADLGKIGTALEPLRDLGAIRADIVSLAARLDQAQKQPQTAPTEELARQIAALGAAVERTAAAAPSVDNLERRLAAIGATLEQLVTSHAENGIDELRSAAQDMRGMVESLPDFTAVERRFDEIARRIEGAPAPSFPLDEMLARIDEKLGDANRPNPGPDAIDVIERRFDEIARKIDGAPAPAFPLDEMLARIGEKLGDANRPNPGPDPIDVIERRFDEIARRLEETPAPAPAPAFPLEEMVERLGEKLDEARRPDATATAFDALERQLASMTEALSRNDDSYAAVRSLERSVSSLFEKLEETARSHASTAEHAARLAAQTVATTIAENVVQAPAPVQASPDPRTQEALEAVQSTLHRIMDRLGSLEADIAAGRTASAAEPSSTIEKAALAAAKQQVQAPTVAEKIAAAAAAAKAAKAAEPVKPARPADMAPPPKAEEPPPSIASRREAIAPPVVPPAPMPAPAQPTVDETTPEDLASTVEPIVAAALAEAQSSQTIALDLPLEPGTGRPNPADAAPAEVDLGAEVPAPESDKSTSSFIAAAREAALSAQAPRRSRKEQKAAARGVPPSLASGAAAKSGSLLERTRRPILIGLAVVVLALGTAQVLRTALTTGNDAPPAGGKPADAPPQTSAPERSSDAGKAIDGQDPVSTGTLPQGASGPAVAPKAPPVPALPPGSLNPGPASGQSSEVVAPRLTPDAVAALGNAPNPPAATIDPAPVPVPPLGDLGRALLPTALQKAANGGNPAAAYEVAVRLQEGKGIPRDPKLAARWFERAATMGVAPAQYRLGSAYEKGVGVTIDLALARSWYEKAAAKGNAKAMHNLGVLAADGGGGKPDYVAAASWFRKAAELGVRDSQYNLAILTARGLGVAQNLAESYMWFSLASAQGDEDAGRKREDVAARLDATTLANAKAATDGFRARTPDPAANEVTPPPGGWDDKAKSAKS